MRTNLKVCKNGCKWMHDGELKLCKCTTTLELKDGTPKCGQFGRVVAFSNSDLWFESSLRWFLLTAQHWKDNIKKKRFGEYPNMFK